MSDQETRVGDLRISSRTDIREWRIRRSINPSAELRYTMRNLSYNVEFSWLARRLEKHRCSWSTYTPTKEIDLSVNANPWILKETPVDIRSERPYQRNPERSWFHLSFHIFTSNKKLSLRWKSKRLCRQSLAITLSVSYRVVWINPRRLK